MDAADEEEGSRGFMDAADEEEGSRGFMDAADEEEGVRFSCPRNQLQNVA